MDQPIEHLSPTEWALSDIAESLDSMATADPWPSAKDLAKLTDEVRGVRLALERIATALEKRSASG